MHLFLQKMLITATTIFTLLVFAVSIAIFISSCVITRGCIDNFNWTGFSRQIDTTKRLIYFKTLVYIKTRIVPPSFLFTVRTVTGVIVTLLTFLSARHS